MLENLIRHIENDTITFLDKLEIAIILDYITEYSIYHNKVKVLRYILSRYYNKCVLSELLKAACKTDNTQIVSSILQYCDCVKSDESINEALLIACRYGNISTVRVLLDNNFDVNYNFPYKEYPVLIACSNRNCELVNILVNQYNSMTKDIKLVYTACSMNDLCLTKLVMNSMCSIKECYNYNDVYLNNILQCTDAECCKFVKCKNKKLK